MRFRLLLIFLVCLSTISQADDSVWAAAYNPATGERFIPVELWTGGDWDGKHEIRMAPAKLVFGPRGEKSLNGPVEWVRPSSGEKLQVYERTQVSSRGEVKKQLFTVSSRGDGLGRVFDSRYGRDCIDEVKFPLGVWKQGEKRVFEVSCNGGKLRRTIEVSIEEIDFVYRGVAHPLRFHWLVDGGRGEGTDNHYTYSPGSGMSALQED